jgi:hypothetical protein
MSESLGVDDRGKHVSDPHPGWHAERNALCSRNERAAMDRRHALEELIVRTPAHTAQGVAVQLRLLVELCRLDHRPQTYLESQLLASMQIGLDRLTAAAG